MEIPDDWWDPADQDGIRAASGEGPILGKNLRRGNLVHIAHPESYAFCESLCDKALDRDISTYSVGHPYRLCRACYKLYKGG